MLGILLAQPQRADHERSGSGLSVRPLLLGYSEPARVGIEDGDAAVGADPRRRYSSRPEQSVDNAMSIASEGVEEDEVVAQDVCSDVLVAAQGTRLAAVVAQDEF